MPDKKKAEPVILWCYACGVGFVSTGDIPDVCVNPECAIVGNWTTLCPTPRVAYVLTHNDRRFLMAMRIKP